MTCYEIFKECFPELKLTEKAFNRLSDIENVCLLTFEENSELCGFALVEKIALRLLCVLPKFQNKGIGTNLLLRAKEFIRQNGGSEILTGGASSQLLIGAPEKAVGFFKKHGFEIVGSCDEMSVEIQKFDSESFDLPVPDGCCFGWFESDFEKLKSAVSEVDESWVQYFSPESRVFCGFQKGEIASFCMIDYDSECILSDGISKVGVIGCVGTVPRFRKKGIGLKMVAMASDELKKHGSDLCFIHYTGVAHWYAKLGCKTFLKLYFCKKDI